MDDNDISISKPLTEENEVKSALSVDDIDTSDTNVPTNGRSLSGEAENGVKSSPIKTYSGKITKLKPNQIIVVGTNTQGRHGKGAALWAKENAGAIYGQAEGIQGKTYGIITKDLTKSKHPSRTVDQIKDQISNLYKFAIEHPDKEFLVAYSKEGSNLNAYSSKEMADMFSSLDIPKNMVFEEKFSKLLTFGTDDSEKKSKVDKNQTLPKDIIKELVENTKKDIEESGTYNKDQIKELHDLIDKEDPKNLNDVNKIIDKICNHSFEAKPAKKYNVVSQKPKNTYTAGSGKGNVLKVTNYKDFHGKVPE